MRYDSAMAPFEIRGPWDREAVEAFLDGHLAPLRVSVPLASGYPLLCSLWFQRDGARLLCATKASAGVARALTRDPRCAFELAPNEPPYYGVRGRARAAVERTGAVELLRTLIDRYLGDSDPALARWLLDNADDEVILALEVERISSWDYRQRMAGAAG